MRINDGSICADCKHFEHECGDDDCEEYCFHPDAKIKDAFHDDYDDYRKPILNCKGCEVNGC